MKLITAYIQPFMAEKVTDALRAAKVHGVTFMPCQGFGRIAEGKVQVPHYLDEGTQLGFVQKTKLEIVCGEEETKGIIATIKDHAHTGHHGDGKIFVSTIDEVLDIRTGQTGAATI